jgi:hypothetical protein
VAQNGSLWVRRSFFILLLDALVLVGRNEKKEQKAHMKGEKRAGRRVPCEQTFGSLV